MLKKKTKPKVAQKKPKPKAKKKAPVVVSGPDTSSLVSEIDAIIEESETQEQMAQSSRCGCW
jgi:hypothetical protein